MEPESQSPSTLSESCLDQADAHGLCYDDAGKSFGDVARDYCQTGDAYRELLTPEARGDGLRATRKATASAAHARALLIEDAIERWGGHLALYVDPVLVRDPNGRIVPPRQSSEATGEGEDSAPVPFAALEGSPQQHDSPTMDRGFRP